MQRSRGTGRGEEDRKWPERGSLTHPKTAAASACGEHDVNRNWEVSRARRGPPPTDRQDDRLKQPSDAGTTRRPEHRRSKPPSGTPTPRPHTQETAGQRADPRRRQNTCPRLPNRRGARRRPQTNTTTSMYTRAPHHHCQKISPHPPPQQHKRGHIHPKIGGHRCRGVETGRTPAPCS